MINSGSRALPIDKKLSLLPTVGLSKVLFTGTNKKE